MVFIKLRILTHIHLVRIELYTVTKEPVIISSLRVKIKSVKIKFLI